ncbi:MAG: hypothetical protein FJY95_13120 [Candidatus Handelsmanbacteria bacterium]|nr:hypothetical protein [Candidatus Handelsmanbacteria bacterium]
MDKIFKVEVTLSGELAELYEQLLLEVAAKSVISLSEMNRTLLQTGVVQHLLMLQGMGLIQKEGQGRQQVLIDLLSRDTLMWELVQLARKYWRSKGGGLVNLQA